MSGVQLSVCPAFDNGLSYLSQSRRKPTCRSHQSVFVSRPFAIFFALSVAFPNVGVSQQTDGTLAIANAADFSKVNSKRNVINRKHTFSSFRYTTIPTIDLGSLDAGSEVELVLALENKSGTDFHLKKIVVSCSCMDVRASSNEIKLNDSLVVNTVLKVPSASRNPRQSQSLNLEGIDGAVIQMQLRYEIAGLCSFSTQAVNIAVNRIATSIAIKLPVVVTEPVKLANIKAYGTDDYSKANATVVKTADGYSLICDLAVPDREGFTMAGTFCVENPVGGGRDFVQCFIGREAKVVVLPNQIRFFRSNELLEASVVIRVNKDALSDESIGNAASISVGAAVGKTQAKVVTSNLSRGIARVKISFKESELIKVVDGKITVPPALKLQVSWDGDISESEHLIVFE